MGLLSTIKLFIRTQLTPTSPYLGGSTAEVDVQEVMGSGTTILTADKMAQWTTSTATNVDVDIRAQLDGNGAAAAFAEVVAICFQTPAANPGTISIKPGAANSWLALLPSASDIITLLPGTTLILFCPAATAYAMGASTDRINVTSSSGTSSATITVIGRSA